MRFLTAAPALFPLVLLAAVVLVLTSWTRGHRERLPWTPLDLSAPVGPFTRAKLNQLAGDPARCEALLTAAQVRFTPLPRRRDAPACGYDDAVRLRPETSSGVQYAPPVAGSCRIAAGLFLWERDVVGPAARHFYGARVTRIETFGTYNCRRTGGGREGGWSEHAAANAIDIAGFRLSNGHRISVAADWTRPQRDAAFLHAVRDGACGIFATVLSPAYNAAHRDHLHFDQAARPGGWSACR